MDFARFYKGWFNGICRTKSFLSPFIRFAMLSLQKAYPGLAPNPTSFFVLKQRTKQENSAKTIANALCRKAGISGKAGKPPCLKFQTFSIHTQRCPRVLAWPPHGA